MWGSGAFLVASRARDSAVVTLVERQSRYVILAGS